MTVESGTPIAGVLAGTQQATAIVCCLLSQSIDMGTQMSVHTIKGDRDGHNENDVVRSHTCESASLKGLVKG